MLGAWRFSFLGLQTALDLCKVTTPCDWGLEHAKEGGENEKSPTNMKFWVQTPAPQRGEEPERDSGRRVSVRKDCRGGGRKQDVGWASLGPSCLQLLTASSAGPWALWLVLHPRPPGPNMTESLPLQACQVSLCIKVRIPKDTR